MSEPPGEREEPGPVWLESHVLFARFWLRLPAVLAVTLAVVVIVGLTAGWDRLHQWTSALVVAGLACWAAALVLLLVFTTVAQLGSRTDRSAPLGVTLLPLGLVLAFAGLVPLGAGMMLAALLT